MNVTGTAQAELTRGQKIAESRKSNRERVNHWEMLNRELAEVVATGRCPRCGGAIHRNRAMTGLWQCDRLVDGFRQDGLICTWQVLVES